MNPLGCFFILFHLVCKLVEAIFGALFGAWTATPALRVEASPHADSEEWKTSTALRTYASRDGCETMATIQTDEHAFYVDLRRLADCSEYFRALTLSRIKEMSESFICLDHVPSSVFHNLLEFSFHDRFIQPQQQELAAHIQVSSYLLAKDFLSKCLSNLLDTLGPEDCLSCLSLAQELCCEELKMTVFTYLSRNLLELQLIRSLDEDVRQQLVHLRAEGTPRLCSLRKENLTSWSDPETEESRRIFTLRESEQSTEWCSLTEFPFRADKWCYTAVVLHNYLYIIGGFRERVRRGWEFKMASFRYNPLTHTWVHTAPLIKHRRHFSAVACDGCIYAVGGWYLDSLVTPDSSTSLYTAVECYDPWKDTWRFVSSLPLTDFQFTMSMSHDVPLAASLGPKFFVLGNIQRTGEKLLLQYDARQDSWTELLPTLTRTDADLPTLYFLGVTNELLVIGGNNFNNVLISFCVKSQKWGQAQRATKVSLAGQGTVSGDEVLMPSIEHNTAVKLDLQTLSVTPLPLLPISTCYDAVFHLCF